MSAENNTKFNPFKTPRDAFGLPILEDQTISSHIGGISQMKGDQFFNLLQLPIPESFIGQKRNHN